MKSGLLWYDNSKEPLSAKINRARARYQEKHGIPTDTICINPDDAARDDVQFEICKMLLEDEGVKLEPVKIVQVNYIWLGIATKSIHDPGESPADAERAYRHDQPDDYTEPAPRNLPLMG